MVKIINSGCGKTTEVIQEAARFGCVLVCNNVERITRLAKKHNYQVP